MNATEPTVSLSSQISWLTKKGWSQYFELSQYFGTVCWVTGMASSSLLQQQQHPFNSPLSGATWVSRYQKGKTSLDLLEQETVSGSGISSAICKSAPRLRQIIMPAPHHSGFYRQDALPAAQPTVSEYWRQPVKRFSLKTCSIYLTAWPGSVIVRTLAYNSRGREFDSRPFCCYVASCSHTHVPVSLSSINLVMVAGQRCPTAGKVTFGLASHWLCITDLSGLSTYQLKV